MATIARLKIDLIADTRGFAGGMAKAKAVTGGFVKRVQTANGVVTRMTSGLLRLGGVAGGLSLAAAAASVTALVRRQFEAIDSSAKFADELGITTEALGGYRHAAKLTGTAQSTLEKGLQRLVRRLGEAKSGYGEGRRGLERLRLDADAVASMRPEAALGAVADALVAIESPAERAAAAYSLFGRQGQEMLNFLALGSDGLAQTRAEAEKLGTTFSRVDARQVEEMNDSITRLKTLATSAAARVGIDLAPSINRVVTRTVEWATANGGLEPKIRAVTYAVRRGVRTARDWIDDNYEIIILTARVVAGTVALSVALNVVTKAYLVARTAALAYAAASTFVAGAQTAVGVSALKSAAGLAAMGSFGPALAALKFGLVAVAIAAAKVVLVAAAIATVFVAATAAVTATSRAIRDGENWFEAYGDAAHEMVGGILQSTLAIIGLDKAILGATKAQIDYQEAVESSGNAIRFARQQLEAEIVAASATKKPLQDQISLREDLAGKLQEEVAIHQALRDAAADDASRAIQQARLDTLESKLKNVNREIQALTLQDFKISVQADFEQLKAGADTARSAVESTLADLQHQINTFNDSAAAAAFDKNIRAGVSEEDAAAVRDLTQQLEQLQRQRDAAQAIADVRREIEMLGMSDVDVKVRAFAETATAKEQVEDFRRSVNELERKKIRLGITEDLAEARRELDALRYGEITLKLDDLRHAGATLAELQAAKMQLAEEVSIRVTISNEQTLDSFREELANLSGKRLDFRLDRLAKEGLDGSQLQKHREELQAIEELQKQIDAKRIELEVTADVDDLRFQLENFGKTPIELQFERDLQRGVDSEIAAKRRDFALSLERRKSAADIIERNKTAAERATEELQQVRALLNSGELTQAQFQREQQRIAGNFATDEETGPDRRSPSLIDLSTGAGQAKLVQIQQQRAGATAEEKLLTEQRSGNRLLERIAENTRRSPAEEPVF
ncbi:MAG: hypothetical protein AAF916_04180 [Planctomycetota bacterium]